ncbi:unnamed protein product [Larinioides sclopetarius]|uniref:BPTI/Kunitz inhibitor domain-containing protein n=2 Tax=Larinioides sclopetarius TaxID=280406 RepID=A0AAV1Z8S6_9ARAC
MWTLLMLALCSSLQEGMRPSHCQSLCSENEKFVNNVNPCNTCENSEVCLFDTDGGPGCDCLPEFYRNKEGKCVPKEECEGGPPSVENGALRRSRPANQIQCRKDEVFLECSCERTCCNGGRTEGCSASCKKGCFCKKGLVRHEDGRCIRLKDCKKEKGENNPGPGFPPVQCSIPKCDDGCSIDYSTKPCPSCSCRDFPSIQCDMPKCDDGCSIDYSTKPCPSCSCPDFPAIQCDIPKCDEDCNIDYSTKPCPSCSCQDSPPVLCSIPNCDAGCNIDYSSKPCPSCSCPALPSPTKCRPDEQYYECIPLCHGTCSAYLTKSYLFCKMACRSGCFCRKGLYKTEDGRCVPASQCTVQNTPENTCGANEEYKECGSACPPTCADRGKKSKKCTKQCVSGCFCKKGFVKNGQGVCVRPQECQKGNPPVQCSPPKCAPGCSIDYSSKPCPSCSCTGNPPVQCSPPKCARGCSIDYSSKPCPSCSCTDTCGANAEYRECGSACPPTCADRGKKNKICTMQCVSGCFCKKGFVKNNRGVCVKPQECEQNTCGENEEYRGCGSACPTTCANLGKNVMCTMQCVPGCYCAKGLVRNDQGKCVRPEECPQNSVATTGNPGDMCTKDEEYQECGSACPATCENIGKNLPCTLQCVPGCFCKKGLVRSDQGDCVEPQECPENSVATTGNPGDMCTEDEEYQECGSACPSTCENIGKNLPCTLQCVPGCFCKKGLVRNDQGDCVEPEECPQRNCGEDEMYLSCGSACAPTCSTLGRTDFACIALCVPGCFCTDGLVRNDQGECVEPEECPQDVTPIPAVPKDSCREDEVYLTCGSACPPTCSTLRRTDVACISLCVQGCFCRDGLVRNDQGECVEPEECPQKKCPKNEEYSDCVIPCNDCKTRGNCNFLVCNKGCDCREGYYRDFNGRCILSRQCPQILPTPPVSTCKADEQYYECIPSCDRTCKAYRRKEKIFCNQICISGCFCKDGLYLADDGKTCVPPEQCDKTPSSPTKKCPKNEEYSDCVVPCNDCQTRGKCNFLVCNKGCDCRKGYYRDFNGRCIPARQCPLIDPTPAPADCSPDQQYYECIPRCSRTCKAYTKSVEIFCNQLCVEGCFCKEGLYEAEDGSCVPPEQCSAPTTSSGEQCPENEEYSDCVNPCNDCQTRGNCNFLVCNKGCDCKKGYYRDFDGGDGRCILGLQCPMIGSTPPPNQCGVDEQFYDCIPGCQQTCFALTSEVKIACKMPCRSGCYCREGLYKKDDDTCVQPEECYDDDDTRVTEALPGVTPTKTPSCGTNEEYYGCIPTCKNTCENYQAVKPLCPRICIAGCSCKKGFVKRSDGKCVKPEKCNKSAPTIKPTMTPTKTPSCGTNEEYYGCIPTCKNTCENYQAVKPLCPRICIAGCSCKKGFVKRSDGKCVKPEKCNKSAPTIKPTKPNQQCGPEEQYYSCIPTCKNTCDNYQAKHPICPRICRRGCFCKKGLVKRRDGKCVKPEKCQSSAPQPTASLPTSNPTCQLEKEVGPCRASLTRYFYNYRTRQCEKFKYGGCRGNKNNFKTIDECQVICGGDPDCQQPKEVGPCRAIMPRFFFNQESRQCEQFNYGGCRGNKNNFKTKEDCESKCGSGKEMASCASENTLMIKQN